MDLHDTILGLLNWIPSSGYDLKRIISDSEVFYWSGNNNQIYKALLELEKDGLVTHQVQLQESLPAKKIYSITAAGQAALIESLRLPPQVPEFQKSFLLQLAWADNLSDDEILALLGKYEEEIANRLLMCQARPAIHGGSPNRSQRERYLWQRITENLIATYQAELDWVRQTQAEFCQRKYQE
jgi:DNA-binding PadR family transcriptional regulator